MIVKIFTGPLNYDIKTLYNKDEYEYIIGVDQGCKQLLDANIKIDLALGDFDSSAKQDIQKIVDKSKKTIVHNKIKDYTDTFNAVKEALLLDHDEVIIYGGIGNRFDHTFANVNLLKLGNIKIVNDESMLYMLDPGEYKIDNTYNYISFFAIEDVSGLSLSGFKYPLDDILLNVDNPLCISNEGSGVVRFNTGLLLVVQTND